jgi:integrase/recombinase XerD
MSLSTSSTRILVERLGGTTSDADAERYHAVLRARRLATTTTDRYLQAVVHFAEWRLTRPAATMTEDVATFLAVHLGQCTCPCLGRRALIENRAALHLWRCAATTGPVSPPPLTPVEAEVIAYDTYLRDTCGAAVQTRLHRTRHVRAFLTQVFGDCAVLHEAVRPAALAAFVADRAPQVKPSTTSVIASDLRSYVRYLALCGVPVEGLGEGLPRVAQWRLSGIPRHLAPDDLTRFLAAFDRRTPRSQRDYAMALCLATWGLRASEVAGLRLADIDWRTGAVVICSSKTCRARVMPLMRTIGDALAAYLRVRPLTPSDHVFVYLGVREGDPIPPSVVRSAVRLGYRRAGLPTSFTGTHRLRHTAATRLIMAGASIKEVADVLGHASLEATAIYAKVDDGRLRQVAMPWPEVSR